MSMSTLFLFGDFCWQNSHRGHPHLWNLCLHLQRFFWPSTCLPSETLRMDDPWHMYTVRLCEGFVAAKIHENSIRWRLSKDIGISPKHCVSQKLHSLWTSMGLENLLEDDLSAETSWTVPGCLALHPHLYLTCRCYCWTKSYTSSW